MLANIYYFIGLFVLLTSVVNLFNFLKFSNIKRWSESFKKHTGKAPSVDDFKDQESYSIFIISPIFTFIQLIWFIFGLISNEWYLFLTIITFSFILSSLFKNFKNFFIEKIFGLLFSLFKMLIILFLIINHFHLNYDILQLIIK